MVDATALLQLYSVAKGPKAWKHHEFCFHNPADAARRMLGPCVRASRWRTMPTTRGKIPRTWRRKPDTETAETSV